MMIESVRERLLSAITTATQGEYGEYIAAEDELPITVVADGDDTSSTNQYGITSNEMPVSIARAETATSQDKNNKRKQAHIMLVSIMQKMFTDPTFTGLASRLNYTGCSIQTEGPGGMVFAQANFTATYQHLAGNPLALPSNSD